MVTVSWSRFVGCRSPLCFSVMVVGASAADVFLLANEEAAQMILNVCGVMELSGCGNERETEEYVRMSLSSITR